MQPSQSEVTQFLFRLARVCTPRLFPCTRNHPVPTHQTPNTPQSNIRVEWKLPPHPSHNNLHVQHMCTLNIETPGSLFNRPEFRQSPLLCTASLEPVPRQNQMSSTHKSLSLTLPWPSNSPNTFSHCTYGQTTEHAPTSLLSLHPLAPTTLAPTPPGQPTKTRDLWPASTSPAAL